MRNIRMNYKRRRAELIVKMKDEDNLSFNKIAFALGGTISPQRVKQVYDHYKRRIEPYLKKEKEEFLKDLTSDS